MSDKEMRAAEEHASNGELEIAHSIYARLAHRYRKFGDATKAAFYNLRAGIYAPKDPNDHAAGYVAVIEDDDDE